MKIPMKYWTSEKSGNFPGLRIIARWLLIHPSSSAPSESLFSMAGNTVGVKRTSLAANKVDGQVFLNAWYRFQEMIKKK
eukprot:UN11678